MEVSGIAGGGSGATSFVDGPKQLGQDEFLKLLTTQLQYQDPIKPVSNEAFVAQLAQFAALEQTSKVASAVKDLVEQGTQRGLLDLVPLIGRQVTVQGQAGEMRETVTAVSQQEGRPVLALSNGQIVSPLEIAGVR